MRYFFVRYVNNNGSKSDGSNLIYTLYTPKYPVHHMLKKRLRLCFCLERNREQQPSTGCVFACVAELRLHIPIHTTVNGITITDNHKISFGCCVYTPNVHVSKRHKKKLDNMWLESSCHPFHTCMQCLRAPVCSVLLCLQIW
jgi:hypothetical protein